MIPRRLVVRLRVERAPDDLVPAIDAFHRFIQRGLVEGLVLDVADYRHVPDGPGVVLIGHDVDYALAPTALAVVRKRATDDDLATQFRDALRLGLGAVTAIADDPTLDVEVDPSRLTVAVPDRALGLRDEVAAGLDAAVREVLGALPDGAGDGATVTPVEADDPRTAPEVVVEVPGATVARLLAALGGSRAPLQGPWDVPVEELARLRDEGADFLLLDVREEAEYEQANLGGRLLPLGQLADRIDELDRDAKVLVHCRAGRRGATAVAQLREAGFADAWNVNGALAAWRERIDPTLPLY